jgi:hypothetical protein
MKMAKTGLNQTDCKYKIKTSFTIIQINIDDRPLMYSNFQNTCIAVPTTVYPDHAANLRPDKWGCFIVK